MLKSALILLVTLTPSTAYSQGIPEWVNRSGWACYDLKKAKSLKIYELDCEACKERLKVREAQFEGCSDALDRALPSYEICKKNAVRLAQALNDTQNLLNKTDKLLDSSEAWSLKGGALPWAIAGGLAILAAGFVAGIAL